MGTPKRILWVDVETTGLDPQTDHIIELGACLTNLKGEPLSCQEHTKLSVKTLGPGLALPAVPDDVAAINGYDPVVWGREAIPMIQALSRLADLIDDTTVLGAQNAPFDKGFISNVCRAYGVDLPKAATYHWLDVGVLIQTRLWFPGHIERPKLSHAADHLGLKTQTHRALDDAILAAEVYCRLVAP